MIVAQNLIKTRIPIGTIIFMSSDSGSATEFRVEDGYEKTVAMLNVLNLCYSFAAYAASKAGLNQMLRVDIRSSTNFGRASLTMKQHMAAELRRENSYTSILIMHPGEVAT